MIFRKVPKFTGWPRFTGSLSARQREFLVHFETRAIDGEFLPLEGYDGYLTLFMNRLFDPDRGYPAARIERMLRSVLDNYPDCQARTERRCRALIEHCLLFRFAFSEYLEFTDPGSDLSRGCCDAWLRLNFQFCLGKALSAADICRVARVTLPALSKQYPERFYEYATSSVNALELAPSDVLGPKPEGETDSVTLFLAVKKYTSWHTPMSLPRPWRCNGLASPTEKRIKGAMRRAENELRDTLDIPRIGEGWISETLLFKALRDYFDDVSVVHHGRPAWLAPQHFDIWIPEWRIAVERQGQQHYGPVEFFGGEKGYRKNVERDLRKTKVAEENGVRLIVAPYTIDTKTVIGLVEKARCEMNEKR